MMSVVSGRAMMSPMKPSKAPHTESDNRITAGLRPMAFPIIFGVSTVSAALSNESITIGMNARPWT